MSEVCSLNSSQAGCTAAFLSPCLRHWHRSNFMSWLGSSQCTSERTGFVQLPVLVFFVEYGGVCGTVF